MVWNLLDNDHFAPRLRLFKPGASAHHDAPTAGVEGIPNPFDAVNDTSCRKIGRLDEFHEVFDRAVWIVDKVHHAFHHFAEVVRRHVGRHAHGNARGPVDQKVGNFCGENRGFFQALVEVGPELHGLFVEIRQHVFGHFPQSRLGVTHGGGVVPIDGAKVPLSVNHGVSQGPMLGHAHHGIVHRAVSVRVILAQHLPYNPC